jgi:glycosyltransferase involved in cell wall biosynthesis
MKLLFVQKEGGIFGAETFQLNIIPRLLERGIEIEFLRLYANHQGGIDGRFVDLLKSLGVAVYQINIGKYFSLAALFEMHRLIKRGKYDFVHTHLVHADLYASLIKLFLHPGLKFVSTKHGYDNRFTAVHGFDASKQGITPYAFVVWLSERMAIGSYTISDGLRNFFVNAKLATSTKMKRIHYGFDFDEPAESWKDPSFRKFKRQLVIAGRLVAFKGHRYVIDGLPEILRAYPDTGLVVVGIGKLEQELRDQCGRLGVSSNVFFAGYSQQVRKWMFQSDMVLIPSISEGFGVVFLEAFSCYKPVVAFDVPASNELVIDGRTGYLVPGFDVSKFASTVCTLLGDPGRAQTFGSNANRRLKEDFSVRRMVDETVNFYTQILASR